MAEYDVLSTKERIGRVRSIIGALKVVERLCRDAQKIHDRMVKSDQYVFWGDLTQYTQEALDSAGAELDRAKTLLDELTAEASTYKTHFTFQAEWVVGKGGIASIIFDAAGKTIKFRNENGDVISNTISNGGIATNATSYVVKVSDLLFVNGTSLNDGIKTADTIAAADTIVVTNTVSDETCTTTGATVTLIRRNI